MDYYRLYGDEAGEGGSATQAIEEQMKNLGLEEQAGNDDDDYSEEELSEN